MHKTFLIFVFTVLFTVNTASADALSNSLNNMLKQKNTPGMVNLNGVSVGGKKKLPAKVVRKARKSRPDSAIIGRYKDGKPVRKKEANAYLKKVTKGKIKDLDLLPRKQRLIVLKDLQRIYAIKHFKSRPTNTIVATVNNHEIQKKELDTYLKLVTNGNVKDFDRLDKKQRAILVGDFAKPIVIQDAAEQNLTKDEKDEIFRQMWLQKQRKLIEVTSEEMLALYELKKSKALAVNPNAQIPHYMSLGDNLKNEILEQKIMATLMKDVNITVNEDSNESILFLDINSSSTQPTIKE